MLGMGSPPGQTGWLVHLRDPSQKIDPQVLLKDESVSTSEQTPPSLLAGDSPGHIIDPDTGRPLETGFAVSAVAKTGMASDALSTTLLLLGPDRGKALVQRVRSEQLRDAAGIWISHNARIETTAGGSQILFGKKS
jgi:thiamine biosynthesis lipoprotein